MADDVQVANRRLDASGNEALIGMARLGADAFGYTDLRIDRGLAQLRRLRVSQPNNCTYRLNLHYQSAREAGIPRAKIDTLTAWWETELHSAAEQAALRYTEALTRAAGAARVREGGHHRSARRSVTVRGIRSAWGRAPSGSPRPRRSRGAPLPGRGAGPGSTRRRPGSMPR